MNKFYSQIYRVNRPVRLMLDRDEDMSTTGTRHPFMGRYKVGFTNNGQLRALQVDLYSNCGTSLDMSEAVSWTLCQSISTSISASVKVVNCRIGFPW